eukprot:TRINITY_DN4394_c0_g2_i2.p1 TRINITY_DN4394_c0_g2~~TRINITY_DN4394_c0_g2_i2.p1  ORF type:complete len:153 (-),score=21.58 TRINITY_DN4394_c0_g2_i2:291-749(-)
MVLTVVPCAPTVGACLGPQKSLDSGGSNGPSGTTLDIKFAADPMCVYTYIKLLTFELFYLNLLIAQVKRFKKCLQKADGKDCSSYSLPAGSVEALRVIYYSALEKLKESVESEASRWRSARSKSVQSRKTKEDVNSTYNYSATPWELEDVAK